MPTKRESGGEEEKKELRYIVYMHQFPVMNVKYYVLQTYTDKNYF